MPTPPDRSAPFTSTIAHHAADPFRLMVESVKDYAIYMLDPSGVVVSWNSGVERIMGYGADEIIGRSFSTFHPPDVVADGKHLDSLRLALAHGSHEDEGERVRKDGTRFWAVVTTTPLLDHFGNHIGFAKVLRDVTERRRAEVDLRESEARSWNLFQAIKDPLTIYDRETLRYLAANDAAVAKYGYSREELLGMTIEDIRPPEDLARLRTMLGSSGLGPEDRGVWRHRTKDGTTVEVEISAYGVEYAGRPACVVQARDVTERRRIEADAARTNELLRAVASGTSDALTVKDRSGKYLLFNAAAARSVGRAADEVLGHDDTVVLGADDARTVMENDRLVMDSGRSQTIEEQLLIRGASRTFESTKVPYRDPAGAVIGVIGISRDISDRKSAEESLLLRDRALQVVSHGILITDATQPDNPIIYATAGFERTTGYRPDEIIGKNCRFLQGKDTDPDTVRLLREAIAAGQSCQVEILNYRKDGTPFWNELSVHPMRDERGALSYFVGIQNDVTGRNSLQAQLRQAQKMEAIGRLAGGIAHDFNNLLTIISGFGEMVLTTPDIGDEVSESVGFILEASERASTLTRQLLGFSRQSMLQPKVLDPNVVIAETSKMLRRLIGEDIHFTTVLDPTSSLVEVDPGQLDQVLLNLAVNARDAMPKGGKLKIETRNVVLTDDYATTHPDCKPGPHVMVAMTDTGAGMTPDVLSRAFEPFFTTKDAGRGTGLGLAVVYGIVQQSGGCIDVHSEPGHGTTFKVYLPAALGDGAREQPSEAPLALQGTETILLVEDEEGVRELGLRSLRRHGYEVLAASDGHDAWRLLQLHRGPLDLILTDVVMPSGSGPELVARARARRPGVKVLFMSGYTDDAVLRHGLLQSEVSFIQKPFTPLALARKVRQVLDEREG